MSKNYKDSYDFLSQIEELKKDLKVKKELKIIALTKKVLNDEHFRDRLAVLNEDILVYDPMYFYFKPLSQEKAVNLSLMKNIISPSIIKRIIRKDCEKEVLSRVLVEVKDKKALICKAQMHCFPYNPLILLEDVVLQLNQVATQIKLPVKRLNVAYKENNPINNFTSYVAVTRQDLEDTGFSFSNSILKDFFDSVIKDASSLLNIKKLLISLITNARKDNLMFVVRADEQKTTEFFCEMFMQLFNDEFKSFFPQKTLLQKNSISSLRNKVVNYCELEKEPSETQKELLKALISPKKITIKPTNGLSFNYLNRTVLLFSASKKVTEFIEKDAFLSNRVCFIDLDNANNFKMKDTDFAYFTFKEDLLNFLLFDYEKYFENRDFFVPIPPQPKKGFEDFIKDFIDDCVEITGNEKEYMLLSSFYDLYKDYCTKINERFYRITAFCNTLEKLGYIKNKSIAKKEKINQFIYITKVNKGEAEYLAKNNLRCCRGLKIKEQLNADCQEPNDSNFILISPSVYI